MGKTLVTEAKVARVVSTDQIALNRGADADIREGDEVTINESLEVVDPDTKESLGHVLVPKLRLRVTLVAERYSVAQSIDEAPPAPWTTTPRPKRVTDVKAKADEEHVLVVVGEEALVRREAE